MVIPASMRQLKFYTRCQHLRTNLIDLHRLLSQHHQCTWSLKKHIHISQQNHRRKQTLHQPVKDLFSNPVDRLQPYLEVPIIPETDFAFKPTREEMQKATEMFELLPVKGHNIEFLGSWPNPHVMPKWNVPEVAFIGRSNVGKSSLLAAMFAQVPDVTVRCSSQPGHTKLMNVYKVGKFFNLVDMPGYGFKMPDHFDTSVEAYIKSRRNIMTFILFDGSVGMTRNDEKYMKRYSSLDLPLTIVLTKIDKAKPSKLLQNVVSVMRFREETEAKSCFPQPFLVSSMNGEGLAFLQAFITHITGNLCVQALSGNNRQK